MRKWIAVLVGLGFLLAAAVIVAAIQFNSTVDNAEQDAVDMSRQIAQSIADELKILSRDGELTDQEIVDTLFTRQSELRSHDRNGARIRVVVAAYGSASGPFGSADGTRCFEFTITEPIAESSVSFTELHSCPPVASVTVEATKPPRR